MRTSKLLRDSFLTGSVRKFAPEMLVLGAGRKAARRAARGSIALKTFRLLPDEIGTPQNPLALIADRMVWRVSKISPIKVGFLLQSRAMLPSMILPFVST